MPRARGVRREAHVGAGKCARAVLLVAVLAFAGSDRQCGRCFGPARASHPRIASARCRPGATADAQGARPQPYPPAQQLFTRTGLARHVSVMRCLGHVASEARSAGWVEGRVTRADDRATLTTCRARRRRSPHDVAVPRHTCDARESGGIFGERHTASRSKRARHAREGEGCGMGVVLARLLGRSPGC
ncbi:hypothetical protein GGF50DRAFT_68787 [Schizophyllum commune]